MRLILSIPLFFYLLIGANIVMLSGPIDQSMLNVIIFEFYLPSKRAVILTVSDAFIIGSLFFLYIETFKATRTSVISIIDHALSLVAFIIFLIEFLIIPRLGNPTFLIIMLASFMDVIIGFTVTISTAKRDFTMG